MIIWKRCTENTVHKLSFKLWWTSGAHKQNRDLSVKSTLLYCSKFQWKYEWAMQFCWLCYLISSGLYASLLTIRPVAFKSYLIVLSLIFTSWSSARVRIISFFTFYWGNFFGTFAALADKVHNCKGSWNFI